MNGKLPLNEKHIEGIRKMVSEGWQGSIKGDLFIATIDSYRTLLNKEKARYRRLKMKIGKKK